MSVDTFYCFAYIARCDFDLIHLKYVLIVRLFQCADCLDRFLIFTGILSSMATGMALPIFTILFKNLVNSGFGGGAGTSADQVYQV